MADTPTHPNGNGRRYRGVILDVDGTLVDSNESHVRAWVEAFADNDYDVAPEQIRPLIGMGGDNLLPRAAGLDKERGRGHEISERRGEIFRERYLQAIRPFPAVRELLERMRGEGLELVVASSSPEQELRRMLELAGVTDLLEATTSADDAESSKPDPDIVQAALERLGLPPREVVMLGDTPYDVEAAGRAGVRVIALRCGGFEDRDLAGALAIYDDPADLLARYDASPLAPADG